LHRNPPPLAAEDESIVQHAANFPGKRFLAY
jgi:hypothetical protein